MVDRCLKRLGRCRFGERRPSKRPIVIRDHVARGLVPRGCGWVGDEPPPYIGLNTNHELWFSSNAKLAKDAERAEEG